jgi:hypothetical protein
VSYPLHSSNRIIVYYPEMKLKIGMHSLIEELVMCKLLSKTL